MGSSGSCTRSTPANSPHLKLQYFQDCLAMARELLESREELVSVLRKSCDSLLVKNEMLSPQWGAISCLVLFIHCMIANRSVPCSWWHRHMEARLPFPEGSLWHSGQPLCRVALSLETVAAPRREHRRPSCGCSRVCLPLASDAHFDTLAREVF